MPDSFATLPTNIRKEINESRRKVHAIVAQLGSFVVPRKDVMIVMPSLAVRNDRHKDIVRRFDGFVIRFVSPNMRCTVHQPRRVQRNRVAQHRACIETVVHGIAVDVALQISGQDEAQHRHQPHVISVRREKETRISE